MKIIGAQTDSMYQNALLNVIEQNNHLFNPDKYATLYRYFLEGLYGIQGVIKAFIYGNSLRFKLIFDNAPQFSEFQVLANMIKQTCEENKLNKIILWCSQIHGKLQCSELLRLLPTTGDTYYFSEYTMSRNIIQRDVDLKGLANKLYSVEMLDDCINILESAFTPFLDTPGTFIREKDWINKSFQLTNKARCEVFFYEENAVGLYSHNNGSIEYLAVKKEYQNRGFGSVILLKAFQSILNDSFNSPYICTGDKNVGAKRFYERVGMKKICDSARVEILPDNDSL